MAGVYMAQRRMADYFESSKDNGKTWQSTEYINDGVEFDAIQPSVLFYPNNKHLINSSHILTNTN